MTQLATTRGELVKKCGMGDRAACAAARLFVISAGSVVTFQDVDAKDDEHPNKMPFKGILLVVDEPSTKPPHGSQGHRIFVPKKVAIKNLDGLIGMGINYDKVDLDGHASRHKVGVITKAWLTGTQVWVEGFIYKKDFPEAVKDLKDRKDLGMSMELAEVYVRDADEQVWHLQDFRFTGATILKKNAAAYYKTALAAQAAAASGKGKQMAKAVKTKQEIAAAGGQLDKATLSAIGEVVKGMVRPLLTEIRASRQATEELAEELEEVKGGLALEAAGKMDDEDAAKADDEDAAKEDDEDAAREDDEDAAKEDDDDDMDAAKKNDDDDDDDDLDAMEDLEDVDVEEEPGEVNKKRGGVNKGKKSSVTDPPRQGERVPGNVAKGRLASAGRPFPKLKSASMAAAAVRVTEISAALQKERKARRLLEVKAAELSLSLKKQKRLIDKMDAQMDRYADQETRRSAIPRDLLNLAAKSNVDLYAQKANGEKLTVGAVDAMFAAAASTGVMLEPETRMAMKNRLLELNLMEQGEENRYQ